MLRLKLVIAIISLFLYSNASPKIIVISDIDDTIQDTQLKPGDLSFWGQVAHKAHLVKNIMKSHDFFIGLPNVYQSLASNGIEIRYVSGAPKLISGVPEKFLQSSGFPMGALSLRPSTEISTEDFKVEEITRIIEQFPEAHFILIGDNGEKDVTVYHRIRSNPQIGSQIAATFIHRLFPTNIGEALLPEQRPYLTAADLAIQLHQRGWLNANQTREVVKNVEQGIDSRFHAIRRRTLPDFVRIKTDELSFFRQLVSQMPDSLMQELYKGTLDKIEKRGVDTSSCVSVYGAQ